MEGIVSFTGTLVCLSVLTMTVEFLMPEGPLKKAVSTAAGMTFLSAALEQIVGLFARIGV